MQHGSGRGGKEQFVSILRFIFLCFCDSRWNGDVKREIHLVFGEHEMHLGRNSCGCLMIRVVGRDR